jgi:hypothetical protein
MMFAFLQMFILQINNYIIQEYISVYSFTSTDSDYINLLDTV